MSHIQTYVVKSASPYHRLTKYQSKSMGRKRAFLFYIDIFILFSISFLSIKIYLTRRSLCDSLHLLENFHVTPQKRVEKESDPTSQPFVTKLHLVPNDHTEMETNDERDYDYQLDPDMSNLFPTRKPHNGNPTLSPRLHLKKLQDERAARLKPVTEQPQVTEEAFQIQKDPDMSELFLTRSTTKTTPMPDNPVWSSLLERQRLHGQEIEFCPSKHKLFNFDNSQCKPVWKSKHPNSPVLPIYKPWHPGPSEQTYGIKDVIIAATMINRGLVIHPFTIHQSDKLSTNAFVPMGLRIDLDKLCNFIELVHPLKKLTQLIIINEKRKHFNKDIVDALRYLEIYMPEVEFDKEWKKSNRTVKMIPGLKCNHFPQEEEQDFVGYFNKLGLDDKSMIAMAHPYRQ